MATFSYTPFSDGVVLTAALLNAFLSTLKTLLETTKLDTDNLSTPYAQFALTFTHTSTLAAGATKVFRWKVPSGVTLYPVHAAFSATSLTGSAAPTFQFTDDATNVLTSNLTASSAATVAETTSFDVATINAASQLVFTMTGVTDTATDLTAVVTFKALIRS